MQFTVYFEAPYWIGVLEQTHDGQLSVARHIFGAEPGDAELYQFVQRDLLRLMANMSAGMPVTAQAAASKNPKRVQREVRRAVAEPGISTKAQEAMRLQIEARKQTRQHNHRAEREALKAYQRQLAVDKAKAKHRGH